jgi:hypothetical protein
MISPPISDESEAALDLDVDALITTPADQVRLLGWRLNTASRGSTVDEAVRITERITPANGFPRWNLDFEPAQKVVPFES